VACLAFPVSLFLGVAERGKLNQNSSYFPHLPSICHPQKSGFAAAKILITIKNRWQLYGKS
jgi:hypothetical protein